MKTMTCGRCDGKKTIQGFGHVANGICFKCAGSGVVPFRKAPPVRPATEYQVRIAEQILAATDDDFAAMTYSQLFKLRDFAHGILPQYPELLKVWRATGEPHFQAAQEERLAEFNANR